ncbi:MAG: Mur ligase domain-containing protein, partial [Aeromicrobium sp.]|uniref:Mur ligase domain-containing protein n=1 Tax=Aeromicrobium sp. TaxID=1871063 RepID=UPI0039E25740
MAELTYDRPRTPPRRPLDELVAAAGMSADRPLPDVPVTGAAVSSDAVRPGDLFAALPGASAHGSRFVGAAAAAGAAAILTDAEGAAAVAAD